MKILTIDKIGELDLDQLITPFKTKSGNLFFVSSTHFTKREACEEIEMFSRLSGLTALAKPYRVDDFREWMQDRLDEELAFYIDGDKSIKEAKSDI